MRLPAASRVTVLERCAATGPRCSPLVADGRWLARRLRGEPKLRLPLRSLQPITARYLPSTRLRARSRRLPEYLVC